MSITNLDKNHVNIFITFIVIILLNASFGFGQECIRYEYHESANFISTRMDLMKWTCEKKGGKVHNYSSSLLNFLGPPIFNITFNCCVNKLCNSDLDCAFNFNCHFGRCVVSDCKLSDSMDIVLREDEECIINEDCYFAIPYDVKVWACIRDPLCTRTRNCTKEARFCKRCATGFYRDPPEMSIVPNEPRVTGFIPVGLTTPAWKSDLNQSLFSSTSTTSESPVIREEEIEVKEIISSDEPIVTTPKADFENEIGAGTPRPILRTLTPRPSTIDTDNNSDSDSDLIVNNNRDEDEDNNSPPEAINYRTNRETVSTPPTDSSAIVNRALNNHSLETNYSNNNSHNEEVAGGGGGGSSSSSSGGGGAGEVNVHNNSRDYSDHNFSSSNVDIKNTTFMTLNSVLTPETTAATSIDSNSSTLPLTAATVPATTILATTIPAATIPPTTNLTTSTSTRTTATTAETTRIITIVRRPTTIAATFPATRVATTIATAPAAVTSTTTKIELTTENPTLTARTETSNLNETRIL